MAPVVDELHACVRVCVSILFCSLSFRFLLHATELGLEQGLHKYIVHVVYPLSCHNISFTLCGIAVISFSVIFFS